MKSIYNELLYAKKAVGAGVLPVIALIVILVIIKIRKRKGEAGEDDKNSDV